MVCCQGQHCLRCQPCCITLTATLVQTRMLFQTKACQKMRSIPFAYQSGTLYPKSVSSSPQCLIVSNNVRQQFQMGRNSLQSSSKSKMRKVPMASSLPTLQSRPHHFCWAHILLRASYQHCILISRSPLPHSDIQKCAKSLRKGGVH